MCVMIVVCFVNSVGMVRSFVFVMRFAIGELWLRFGGFVVVSYLLGGFCVLGCCLCGLVVVSW